MQKGIRSYLVPLFLFSSAILISLVIISGCTGLPPDSKILPTSSPNQGSGGSPGSYVKAAPPIPEASQREVRNLSEKSGEVTSLVMRKAIEGAPSVFTGHYTPRYSSSAFEVHANQGPIIIKYRTIPLQYDPRIAFLKITVRNAKSAQVVAEDGYGNPYPSNPVNMITINGGGDYHVTIYGNQVDVTVSVYTGDLV